MSAQNFRFDVAGRGTGELARAIEQAAFKQLCQEFPYVQHFQGLNCQFENGTLIIEGTVPSFYLKQVLSRRLRDLEGVDRIDDRVAVVTTEGLSSPPEH